MKKTLLLLFAAGWLFSCSDMEDGIEPCPSGNVRVDVYVESFGGDLTNARATATAVTELRFNDRIERMEYLLYKDNVLVERGDISDMSSYNGSFYTFYFNDLEPGGNYKLALLGNCLSLAELPVNPDDITIAYPGHDQTDDYFLSMFPFTVCDTDCGDMHLTTQLKRVHGVVRFTFRDLDPSITSLDVRLDGLSGSGCIMGTYSTDYQFEMNIPIVRGRATGNEPTVVGLFPTMSGSRTVWSVRANTTEGGTPFYDGVALEDLEVVRNRQLNLETGFTDGQLTFRVVVDDQWDDPNDGGGTIVD